MPRIWIARKAWKLHHYGIYNPSNPAYCQVLLLIGASPYLCPGAAAENMQGYKSPLVRKYFHVGGCWMLLLLRAKKALFLSVTDVEVDPARSQTIWKSTCEQSSRSSAAATTCFVLASDIKLPV